MEKQKKDRNRFRKMAGKLDEIGIMTGISRVSKKHFVFYVNGEAVRSFRNRQSCNLRIEKLFEKNKQI